MSVPVMSEGIRSGVNWMRLKVRLSASASVEMSSVFASPGTPTKRQWPREKSAMSSCSTTASWPTTRLAISCAMRARACASSSISSASEGAGSTPFTASSLMTFLFRLRGHSRGEEERLLFPRLQRLIFETLRDLHVGRMQVGIERVHRDAAVERGPGLVQRSALEQHVRVERLRGLVLGVAQHRVAQRLLRL